MDLLPDIAGCVRVILFRYLIPVIPADYGYSALNIRVCQVEARGIFLLIAGQAGGLAVAVSCLV